MHRQPKSFFTLKGVEKLTYLVGIPSLMLYGGYEIYKKNLTEAEKRAQRIQTVEEKYLPKNATNMIKLQNFTKKVYAIGLVDDILDDPEFAKSQPQEWQMKIVDNAALIRDFIKDLQAESVVLEMCDERYAEEMQDILEHPKYDNTMATVHKLLERNPKRLLNYKEIAVDQGNFEMLVAYDTCSYRMMPCKTKLGDRDFNITQKRYQAKLNLLDLYKEQAKQSDKSNTQSGVKSDKKPTFKVQSKATKESNSGSDGNIFDLGSSKLPSLGEVSGFSALTQNSEKEESTELKLRSALKKTKLIGLEQQAQELKEQTESIQLDDKVKEEMSELAKRESQKTEHDIYTEVFIDEVNQELIKSVEKAEGEFVVAVMRQERLKSFAETWRQVNLDYYNTQTSANLKYKTQASKLTETPQTL